MAGKKTIFDITQWDSGAAINWSKLRMIVVPST